MTPNKIGKGGWRKVLSLLWKILQLAFLLGTIPDFSLENFSLGYEFHFSYFHFQILETVGQELSVKASQVRLSIADLQGLSEPHPKQEQPRTLC